MPLLMNFRKNILTTTMSMTRFDSNYSIFETKALFSSSEEDNTRKSAEMIFFDHES